jgi:hypothetical protein
MPDMEYLPYEFDSRMILAMALVIFSCWTTARLASREKYQWLLFLVGPLTGAIVGSLYGRLTGAWFGLGIGVGVTLLLFFLDLLLWFFFTLPPHPKKGLSATNLPDLNLESSAQILRSSWVSSSTLACDRTARHIRHQAQPWLSEHKRDDGGDSDPAPTGIILTTLNQFKGAA